MFAVFVAALLKCVDIEHPTRACRYPRVTWPWKGPGIEAADPTPAQDRQLRVKLDSDREHPSRWNLYS
eukprot:gene24956-biopygen2206